MFEKFTEKARRVIFFSRYEAQQYGSAHIESEHLLLGLLREDKALVNRFLRQQGSIEPIRGEIEAAITIGERKQGSIEVPLSIHGKRILNMAVEESERLGVKHVSTEHLLLGILREEKGVGAQILSKRGLKLSDIRTELSRKAAEPTSKPSSLLDKNSRDLTQAATDGQLNPLVGRAEELEGLIEVLCSRKNKNPILIGERGSGKTAIVEGLAQRIADGEVPHSLEDKRILALDPHLVGAWIRDRQNGEERLNALVAALLNTPSAILFVDELQTLFLGAASGVLDVSEMLKPSLLRGDIQCIGTSTPSDYRKSIQAAPWIGYCFRTINVLTLDEEETLMILMSRRDEYEKFHGLSYTDEALRCAAYYSIRYFPDGTLPAKAMEILDAAGSRVKLRQSSIPPEILEIQKRIRFIMRRIEKTRATHELEKAHFYSEEERKERENLRVMREKYPIEDSKTGIVDREHIEDVISRWIGVPIPSLREELPGEGSGAAVMSTASSSPQNVATMRVFLCHSSEDKPPVRDLYKRLKENLIEPWLDEENLLPGQEWDLEISKAVRSSHVVIVCLSTRSVGKAGYLQREIKKVLDVADEQLEGTIYLIPLKLEECDVPNRLKRWHWVNLYDEKGFERLMQALVERSRALGLPSR
jgi:ATP-dependent Clp protease ATP-binding subunit ClpC